MSSAKPLLYERQYHLDYLRVFASIAIILLHVTAQNMSFVDLGGTEWNVFNFSNSFSRWGVPVFIMMSGALFLAREIPIKKLYKKNILRMAVAYVVWSVFYAIVTPIGKLLFVDGYQTSVQEIIGNCISGAIHLWFLPMIIGLYMCLPLIRRFTDNDKFTRYFLLLSFVFCFLKTELQLISSSFFSGGFLTISENALALFNTFDMSLVSGFISYFVLGYYINKTEIKKNKRVIIYILGVLGFVATILLNLFASKKAGQSVETFYKPNSLNVFLMSVAIFVWFKYNAKGTAFLNKIIIKLSKYSFGAFLVHIFVMQVLTAIGIHSTSFNPLLSVPAVTIITTIVSYLISFILNKIPLIKKYIV